MSKEIFIQWLRSAGFTQGDSRRSFSTLGPKEYALWLDQVIIGNNNGYASDSFDVWQFNKDGSFDQHYITGSL